MSDDRLWKTKLAARLHDPAEKALVLLRDPAGHEGGTVAELKILLALDAADDGVVQRADRWAAAADRPQWPKDQWAQVRWTQAPVLIHPVSGAEVDLRKVGGLRETEIGDIKARSFAHFKALADAAGADLRKTLFVIWRFGPELQEDADHGRLGALWEQLPADTRVPDHSIWEHLDLSSAFAGASAADPQGEVALLALAIGPVQPFIASARSSSDLWAGSHLLSRLSWETMRPLCEALGPDAVLFPRLRGVPQVDLWLRAQGLPESLFAAAEWKRDSTDANPLFAAALPNRFVALVPASQARTLAEECERAARGWLRRLGQRVVERLLKEAGIEAGDSLYCFKQMQRQLEDFPEVHWAAVPFALIAREDDLATENQPMLSEAMKPFFGTENGGFLSSPAWQMLRREIQLEGGTPFFQPNPGVLYPAIYDLAERVLAAAKSARTFGQTQERGYRCSLTGETEWVTTDPAHLINPPARRKDTLWAKVAEKKPSWAKRGEHLGVLSAIKRLWPTLFAEEVEKAVGKPVGRFVVSTHTMALAHHLDRWMEHGGLTAPGFVETTPQRDRVALPQRLVLRHRKTPRFKDLRSDAAKLLALMEDAQESDEERQAGELRRLVRETLAKGVEGEFRTGFQLETYYGLLLMDGDRMGAILSGEWAHIPTYRQCFHPEVRAGFDERAQHNPALADYGDTRRAVSPGRHMAISGALNDFALRVVPHIVQREYLGQLIYAGGDDVLAMFPVADLLPAAARLRDGWSGVSRFAPKDEGEDFRPTLILEKGYGLLGERLLRLMGEHATASAGLIVAHHQTPLSRVLREARAAEKAAKDAGRDRCAIRVLKRSGGALSVVLAWDEVPLLEETRDFLAEEGVSRRAVYSTLAWLKDLPPPADDGAMLAELLAYQLQRQSRADEQKKRAVRLAKRIVPLALRRRESGEGSGALEWLQEFLSVAEFLARETRTVGMEAVGRQARAAGNG